VVQVSTTAPRILVVEDDPDIGRLLLVLLRRDGLEVSLRTNGADGLAGIGELAPDLLLMDVGLPGLDGWTVLARIRAAEAAGGTPRLPVMLVSAHAQESDRAHGLRLGADEVVLKPFSNDDLLDRVRRLLPGGT
jgi:DNA-binding response OmpR family regulator